MKHHLATMAQLPPTPDLDALPKHVDRRRAAELVTHYFFAVSPRSMERWPLAGKVLNGRLTFPTADLFRIARERVNAAPAIKGGPAIANRTA
jgi:hypothetical protein